MKLLAYAALSVFMLGNGTAVFGLSNADLQFLAHGTIAFDKGTDKTTLASDAPVRIVVEASLGGRKLRLFVDTGYPVFHLHQNIVDGNPESFENAPSGVFKTSHFVKALRLGDVVLDGVPVVEDPDFEALEDRLQVDGTLGMSVLNRLNWQFDEAQEIFTIFKAPQPLKDPIDINPFYDLRLVVDGTIDGSKASWAIDTGWVSGYPTSGLQKGDLPPSTILHTVSGRMWKSSFMQDNTKDPTVGVFRNVAIGATKLPAMSFSLLWPEEAYSRDYSGLFNVTGILPIEFFDGGTLQVNGPDGQVACILPQRSSPPTGNTLQLYGFELDFVSRGRWSIVGIDEQSWAYNNGLRLGDIAFMRSLKIGGQVVIDRASEYLRANPHAMVELDYERDGKVQHIKAPYSDPMRDLLFQN